jgi:hypothetical protein
MMLFNPISNLDKNILKINELKKKLAEYKNTPIIFKKALPAFTFCLTVKNGFIKVYMDNKWINLKPYKGNKKQIKNLKIVNDLKVSVYFLIYAFNPSINVKLSFIHNTIKFIWIK